MRIHELARWWPVPLLAVGAAAEDAPFNLVFDWGQLTGHTYSVWLDGITTPTAIVDPSTFEQTPSITFAWNITSSDNAAWTFLDIVLANQTDTLAEGDSQSTELSRRSSLKFYVSASSSSGNVTLDSTLINSLSQSASGELIFFQMQWENSKDPRAQSEYGLTPPFGIASNSAAASAMYTTQSSSNTILAISSVTAAPMTIQSSPAVKWRGPSTTEAQTTSSSASQAPDTKSTGASSATAGHQSQSHLSLGAIIGIAVGGAVFLILLALAIFLCMRHRRHQKDANAARTGVQVMQDMLAEKAARSTVDVGTSYSEDTHSHRPLHRGVGMSGLNHSNASMSMTGETPVRRTTRSLGSTQRDSGAYSPLRNPAPIGTAISTGTGPGDSPTTSHPGSSTPGSPVGRSSTQQDQAFNLFPEASGAQQPEHQQCVRGRSVSQKNSMSNLSNVLHVDHDLEPPSAVSGDSVLEAPSVPGSRAGTPQLGHSRFGVRSATPGGVSISEQYAHLVEDGMTEDEIRRLEEEERALDEAIEQHRTESRATMGR